MNKHCGWRWYGVGLQFGVGATSWLIGAGRAWLFGRAGDDRLEGCGGGEWLSGA